MILLLMLSQERITRRKAMKKRRVSRFASCFSTVDNVIANMTRYHWARVRNYTYSQGLGYNLTYQIGD